jgi:hypothetical protein
MASLGEVGLHASTMPPSSRGFLVSTAGPGTNPLQILKDAWISYKV